MKLKMMGLSLALLATACGSSDSTGNEGALNGGDGDSGTSANTDSGTSANTDSGTSSTGGDCTDTYDTYGKNFLATYCNTCHGGSVTGAARQAAPDDDVFDTLEQVVGKKDEILSDVITTKVMPFGPSSLKPSDADRARFGKWLTCGPN